MKGWPVVGSGLLRVLTLLGVLAGVLAMHALTTSHHTGMVMADTTGLAAVSGQGAHGEHTPVREPAPGSAGLVVPGPQVASADGEHAMGELCVAILTALILLLLPSFRRPFAMTAGGIRRSLPPRLTALLGRSPPWTAPSLSKLCVLRT